jgi:hypothetical protein
MSYPLQDLRFDNFAPLLPHQIGWLSADASGLV